MKKPNLFFSICVMLSVLFVIFLDIFVFPKEAVVTAVCILNVLLLILHFIFCFRTNSRKVMITISAIQMVIYAILFIVGVVNIEHVLEFSLFCIPAIFYIVYLFISIFSEREKKKKKVTNRTLKKLMYIKQLLDSGAITEEEYNMLKKETMASYE